MSYDSKLVERGAVAAKAALDLGATRLEAQVAYEIARMPGYNFQTGKTIIANINARTGAQHHEGSGRRAVISLARKGIIDKHRVHAGHKARGAKNITHSGTTEKAFAWRRNNLHDPVPQHELSRMRKEARRMSKYARQETPPQDKPQHGAAGALVVEVPKITAKARDAYDELADLTEAASYNEFAAMAAQALGAEISRMQRADQRMHDSTRRPRDGPPK